MFSETLTVNDSIITNNGKNDDMYLCKFDKNGKFIWARQSFSERGWGHSIVMDNEQNLYATGTFIKNASFGEFNLTTINPGTYISEGFVAKYDTNGVCKNVIQLGETSYTKIVFDSNNQMILSGMFVGSFNLGNISLTSRGKQDMFFAKCDGITGIENISKSLVAKNNLLTIYANPMQGKCNITIPEEFNNEQELTLQILDNAGKVIQQSKIEIYEETVKINLEAEAKGIYNVVLSNGKKNYTGKIVFE
jgi:hypothetical protein